MSDGYLWFEGIPFPGKEYNCEILKEARDKFEVKDKDVIILAYPKSGTSWLIEILCLINSKGDPKWLQSVPYWERAYWVETEAGYDQLKYATGPRLLISHLPIHLFPRSFYTSRAKLIYVIRNPKDVLVSGYFFFSKMEICKKPESLEQYFQWFIQGHVLYGSWFEHTKGWMSMREVENVLLLSYEELNKDPRSTIKKICQFLGKSLETEELDLVVKNSSFKIMKENSMSNYILLPESVITPGTLITRKGISGDWKNHLTVAQAEAFDKIFQEHMPGFPPNLFPWE
ncbi:3-beta-hydroxysteroid sulfotransferase-like [Ctenodactylus gundi]